MSANTKRGKFGIAIILAIIFILVGIIFLFNNTFFDSQNPTIESQNNIENSSIKDNEPSPITKYVEDLAKKENITLSSSWSSTIDSMPITSEPKFVVGEKYTYFVRWPQPIDFNKPGMHPPNVVFNDYRYFNITFSVEKKERINNTDCYKIYTNGSGEVVNGYVKNERRIKPIISVPIDSSSSCVDIKTGEIINPYTGRKLNVHDEEMDINPLSLVRVYVSWMLKLAKGAKWATFFEDKSTGHVTCIRGVCEAVKKESETKEKNEYEVKGIETVNKRKCFKVEGRTLMQKNGGSWNVMYKKIFWVDVEKRITVKYQLWYQNLNTVEVNLINYERY